MAHIKATATTAVFVGWFVGMVVVPDITLALAGGMLATLLTYGLYMMALAEFRE